MDTKKPGGPAGSNEKNTRHSTTSIAVAPRTQKPFFKHVPTWIYEDEAYADCTAGDRFALHIIAGQCERRLSAGNRVFVAQRREARNAAPEYCEREIDAGVLYGAETGPRMRAVIGMSNRTLRESIHRLAERRFLVKVSIGGGRSSGGAGCGTILGIPETRPNLPGSTVDNPADSAGPLILHIPQTILFHPSPTGMANAEQFAAKGLIEAVVVVVGQSLTRTLPDGPHRAATMVRLPLAKQPISGQRSAMALPRPRRNWSGRTCRRSKRPSWRRWCVG